jgi:large subunit ribosomal protein L23
VTDKQQPEKNTKAGKADRAGKAQVEAKDAKQTKKTAAVDAKSATSASTAATSDKAPKAATLKGAAAARPRVRPMKAMADRVTRALGLGKRSNAPAQADAPVSAADRFREDRLARVLVAPIVSEKATMAGEKNNQVLFKVLRDATKPEIAAAVELMFKVKVDAVQTVQAKGKQKRFGRSIGRRDHIKKAYVCLAKGEQLNFSGESA